jgi:hypothetical protein
MGYPVIRFNSTKPLTFLMVSSADHITGLTGLTPTVTISKNGGPYIVPSGRVQEIGNGMYALLADEFDANTLGPLLLHASAVGADPRDDTFDVVDYNPGSVLPVSPPAAATFGTQSAKDYIDRAFDDLGKAAGETMAAADYQNALRRLNNMVSAWGLMPDTMAVTAIETFFLVAGQKDYTIGPLGDFDTVRPVYLLGAGLVLNEATENEIEIPVGLLSDDAYQAIQVKNLMSVYPQQLYYNRTYTDGLGRITLWPVPDTAANSLRLYTKQAMLGFSSLTAQYSMPPGYDEAIEYNLAVRLARPYGLNIPPEVQAFANESLGLILRGNYNPQDVGLDPALTYNARRRWNILAGP